MAIEDYLADLRAEYHILSGGFAHPSWTFQKIQDEIKTLKEKLINSVEAGDGNYVAIIDEIVEVIQKEGITLNDKIFNTDNNNTTGGTRILDIAFKAFMLSKDPSKDWIKDVKPLMEKMIEKLRKENT